MNARSIEIAEEWFYEIATANTVLCICCQVYLQYNEIIYVSVNGDSDYLEYINTRGGLDWLDALEALMMIPRCKHCTSEFLIANKTIEEYSHHRKRKKLRRKFL